ncbi:MAG: hydroxymethylglutaryl-CoA synthase [Halobacteriales archaeon]|jgi:hydroxymethylglutaryl-CoA synthase
MSGTEEVPRLASIGAYAPRLRIEADEYRDAWDEAPRGIDRTAVPDADEDAFTMAHEAAARALSAGGFDGTDVEFLAFGTTTPPMAEEELTARLRSTLGLPEDVTTRTNTGSTRAGVTALEAGLDAGTKGLIVASDCPEGNPDGEIERVAGAGAAAFVLDDSGARVVDRATYTEPYPGTRFRSHGESEVKGLGITPYDRTAFRETLAGVVERLGANEAQTDVDAAAIQAPDGDLPYRVSDTLGVDPEAIDAAETVRDLGDTGAASAPLGMARALADGADRILLAAFGSGAGSSALLIERSGGNEVPTDLALEGDVLLSYSDYLRRRGEITGGPPAGGGAAVSVPTWRRTLSQRHRLVAGKCRNCGALAFPPEGACRVCAELVEYEAVELAEPGIIQAATTIERGGEPPEFAPQQARGGQYGVAVVAFDGPDGGTATVPLQVPLEGVESIEIGDEVETTIRRIYEDEDVIRYGRKAVPANVRR